jgi:hypothetical protein
MTGQAIQKRARDIVMQNPGGIRYMVLVKQISAENPTQNLNAIRGAVWNLNGAFPKEVSKPTRGLFRPVGAPDDGAVVPGIPEESHDTTIQESDFYQAFADWLKDQYEVTAAGVLGGAGLKATFGTPDVIGVYKPQTADFVKFWPEIVSAEIKVAPGPPNPIVAFGQAVAYRLFSAKTYIVMPTAIAAADQDRLASLSVLLGIGFVLFDGGSKDDPNFLIRVPAQRFSPDMFYANEVAERLKNHNRKLFDELFG